MRSKNLIIFIFIFLSINIVAYDENKEIALIYGINRDSSKEADFIKINIKKWSELHKLEIPKFRLIETTPSRVQGVYSQNKIEIYFSNQQSTDDLLVTAAHEFAHYYFEKKNIIFQNTKKEELKADKFAVDLVGKDMVLKSLHKHWKSSSGINHPSIDERIKKIKFP